jgi:uncharacterized protein
VPVPLRTLLLFLLLSVPLGAAADFEAGVAAARAEDYPRALREWQPLAQSGHRDAQFNLGLLYEHGLGVARDDAEALRWYRRAAEAGDAAAQYNVGLFYAMGRGVAPNDVEAYAWLSVALENGAEPTRLRDLLKKNMSAQSLARGERLLEEVRGQCKLP